MVPSGSVLAEASNVTVWPTVGAAGVRVNDAVGGRSVIVLTADAVAVAPLLSVTVSVTVKFALMAFPVLAHAWLTIAPVPVVPSPKFHA